MPDHSSPADICYLFVGTYHPKEKNGIFVYRLHTATGKASFIQAVPGINNPSFLTLSASHRHLYAVSETHQNKDGKVFAFQFNPNEEHLQLTGHLPTGGDDPCNIITDQTNKALFIANYSSGSLAVVSINEDGSLGQLTQLIQHDGHSINLQRQAGAHVHCAVMSPDNKHLFVTDLGMDKVFCYLFDEQSGKLTPANPSYTSVTPGSGPRLMEFSPDGKFLYLIHEMGGQITVFEQQSGILKEVQSISNLPENYSGKIWAADVHISPDGQFLYAANRDDLNDIVTYKRNISTGKITPIDRQPTGGRTPRNFVISPGGDYILIGHRNGPEITIFKRNETTGMLTMTNERIPVAHAVCLKMIAL